MTSLRPFRADDLWGFNSVYAGSEQPFLYRILYYALILGADK
jgi:hypothetical protein